MNKKENGFSLVIVVIFMSIAALFVGYLMGSWLIGFLVEEDSSQMAEEEISQNTGAQIAQNNQEAQNNQNSEEVSNTENNLTAPPAENEENTAQGTETESQTAPAADSAGESSETSSETSQQSSEGTQTESPEPAGNTDIAGSFGVQIGAFSNYNNALNLQETIEGLGYDVVITDSSPHQVQVIGYQTRDQAESAAAELEEEGYNGFIVIRE